MPVDYSDHYEEGARLPDHPGEDASPAEFWEWLSTCCEGLKTWVPLGSEPDTLTWDDPLESKRKERFEKIAVEEEHEEEIRKALKHFLEEKLEWPTAQAEVAWLVRERFQWCADLAKVMQALATSEHYVSFSAPSLNLRDCVYWLMIDCYHSGASWPKKWWDSSSFEDYYSY